MSPERIDEILNFLFKTVENTIEPGMPRRLCRTAPIGRVTVGGGTAQPIRSQGGGRRGRGGMEGKRSAEAGGRKGRLSGSVNKGKGLVRPCLALF